MAGRKRIKLPDRGALQPRLMRLSDNQHLRRCFFPILLEQVAGRHLGGRGVTLEVGMAIAIYASAGPPQSAIDEANRLQRAILDVLIQDSEVKADAVEMLRRLMVD